MSEKSEFMKWAIAAHPILQGRVDVGVYDLDGLQDAWNAALAAAERVCRDAYIETYLARDDIRQLTLHDLASAKEEGRRACLDAIARLKEGAEPVDNTIFCCGHPLPADGAYQVQCPKCGKVYLVPRDVSIKG